jgi:hypothetical protein
MRSEPKSPRDTNPVPRVKWAYQDVIDKMHELARTLEAEGADNWAQAVRADADAYHVRMTRNVMKLQTANDNGGSSDATH